MLLISAEDETFMSYNRDMDAWAVLHEGREATSSSKVSYEWDRLDFFLIVGKRIIAWLSKIDILAKEVEAELVSK